MFVYTRADRILEVVLVLRIPGVSRNCAIYFVVHDFPSLCYSSKSSTILIHRLNGGPGCSSMIGLFQENGPCKVNPDGETTTLNPFRYILRVATC